MKKILFLLLAFCSFIAYAAGDINIDEINKYVREKLNRDKEITFTYKINKANNTLEGYSEEGRLIAVNSLKDEPAVAQMAGMKTKVSEKNGKLNPFSEIYLANGELAVRNTYKFNKDVNVFATDAVIAYINGEIPYSPELKAFIDGIDRIQIETFENNKLALFTTYEINHKTQQITIKNGLSPKVTITKAVLSINGLNGTMETYYENGKINQKVAIKNGLFNGKVEKFSDKSGKLVGTGTMKDGLPDGEFIEYDEAGKVISKVKYKDGKEVK
ncbi:toxin-antitoxin system YwqK family antitoxin [Fusobacterium simiae]|uniref:Toxin-antitoxin system YwqK family antitoxin n=1 Tax=Fusobacterium simiae TaxID=855 RepID=A0ABT4DJE2_FUSSI|nr:toxin-antitoxin system YwqK family antitoxin [Fusobacterium simiae]MCY7007369.1 toxin-antitoxin system YwqK family antitoxin [Fusobacterium simiae]